MLVTSFFPTLSKRNISFLVTFSLSSRNAFSLEKSKILLFILGLIDVFFNLLYSRHAPVKRGLLYLGTRQNSADSVPTSNLVCIKEVAIRTTFKRIINIAGIICYICSLVIDIQCTRYNANNKRFYLILCQNIFAKIYSE